MKEKMIKMNEVQKSPHTCGCSQLIKTLPVSYPGPSEKTKKSILTEERMADNFANEAFESREFVERQVGDLVMEVLGRLQREEPEKLKELAEKLKKENGNECVN